MFCKNCGKEIKKKVKFCPECGKELLAKSGEISALAIQENEAIEGEVISNYPHPQKVSIIKKLEEIGLGSLGCLLMIGIFTGTILILKGMANWGLEHTQILVDINIGATTLGLFIFFPLTLFQKTKIISVYGLYFGSYVIGITVWLYGLTATYALWGLFWVIVGLFLFGVGVVPIAMIASITKGLWPLFFALLYGIIVTYGFRIYSLYLLNEMDQDECDIN